MIAQKQYERISDISVTLNGDRFAVAEFDTHVQIWDLTKGLLNKLLTDFDFGNRRLSISEDGIYLLIGGYSANTITAYNIQTMQKIWQRKDLKKCHSVKILNRFDNHVFVRLERQGTYILDIQTGDILDNLKGIEFYYENPFTNIDLLEKSTTISLFDRTKRKTIKTLSKTSFAILDTTFSKDQIICAYSGNPLEAISQSNYEKVWTTRAKGHFLTIEYFEDIDKLIGIRWDYEKGGTKYLCNIDIHSGIVEQEIDVGEPRETAFLKRGKLLLTSQGKLYSTLTGEEIRQFDFENH
jgi:WD40 repeat protein